MTPVNWQDIKYFNPKTDKMLACPCCGKCDLDQYFMLYLDNARRIAGVPFIITSGCRCASHNKDIGGVDDSSHVRGYAVDIRFKTAAECFIIIDALFKAGFVRIGIGRNFIHADLDISKPQNVLWNYYARTV